MPSGMNYAEFQHSVFIDFIFALVSWPATNGFPAWKASGNTAPLDFGNVECIGSRAVFRAKQVNSAFLCAFERSQPGIQERVFEAKKVK